MKKMFSCSSNQVAVECWNKQDQKLFDAVEKGDVARVSVLVSKKTTKPTKPNALGQSAFHLAASKGLTECLSILLTHGAEVNEKNEEGSTALHLATIACQPQCVKVLLQHGANEDCVDGENRTPLHWAALSGCASSVLLLCDQEAFLDVIDNNGQTPLMIAAQGNQAAICSQLLQRGAKADLVDKDGKTALILACERGNMEAAELLLQNGANVAAMDGTGHDALHYAAQARNRTLKRLLQNALRKRKRREQGLDLSSEAGSQVPSESGKETDLNSLNLHLEGRGPSDEEDNDQETEEDPELKEWTSRYREEKMKVIQLELQLAQKTRECDALLEGCKAMKERVWDQVQEINQLLPEGEGESREWKELSRRYSRDATEEDYYLNLLAGQIQELKKRKKWLEVEKEKEKEKEKKEKEEEEKEKEKEKEKEEEEKEKKEKEHPKMAEMQELGQRSHLKYLETIVAPREEERVRWPGEEEEEERRRHQTEVKRLQAEMAASREEKANALKRVQEMEGHMENMRAVIRVYEAKKKHQSGTLKEMEARMTELEGENQQLRGLLAKRMDGWSETGLTKVSRFLTEMEEAYSEIQKGNRAVKSENAALKRQAEDIVGSRLLFQAVPSEVVKKSMFAWKKVIAGLEDALAKMEQTNSTLLEKVRPLREAILAPQSEVVMVNGDGHHGSTSKDEAKPLMGNLKTPEEMGNVGSGKSQLHDGSVGQQVKLRPKPEATENKARPCRKSSDLEKEVWDLKENNGSLAKELAQLSKEREKLQEELRRLCGPKEGLPQPEAMMGSLVEELKKAVESLSQQLSAEKEESRKLRLKLEAQMKEMAMVKDNFLEKMAKESTALVRSDPLDSCILKELHWKLDNMVKKQNKALQLVSEIEEENHTLETDRKIHASHNGHLKEQGLPDISSEALDAIRDNWKVHQEMNEMEKILQRLKEALEAVETSLGKESKEVAKLKELLDQLEDKMSDLRREEEEALGKHEKVRGMLSARAQALGTELASLREKCEELRGESARRKEALASERQKNQDLLAEAVEREEELEELRGKSQMMETVMEKMDRKVEELSKACQDRDGKIRKLLKETEKLSSEILNLRSERARLRLQNEVVQKNHQEIVAIYRTHLLNAAQGFMDKEVHEMLLRILRTNDG